MISEGNKGHFEHKCLYLAFHSKKGNVIRVLPKFKAKDRVTFINSVVLDNKEQAAIAQDPLLGSKIAGSLIDTLKEMKTSSEVYVPEINKEDKLKSLASDPLHFQAFHMIIDKIRERIKDEKMRSQKDDFIKKNKVLIKYWNQYEYERRK